MPRLHALPLAAALLLVNACGPAANTEPPVAPPQPVASATATAPPAPPAIVTAGAMPADVQLFAEIAGVPALVAAARAAAGDAAFTQGRAGLAKQLGVAEKTIERLLAAVESVHVGGKRDGGDVKAALSVTFSDPEPVRDLVTSGLLVASGAFGPHGLKLQPKGSTKDRLVWFDGPKLLVIGDAPMLASIAAVVEGRAPGLSDASRAALAPLSGERRVANAFIAPALLDELASGKASFPAPLAAAFGLWEGGLRGSYRASLSAPDLKANLPVPPPRSLTLARRLPVETASYLALSTGLPGGRQAARQLLAQLVAGVGRDADRAVGNIDGALAGVGLRLEDLLGTLGDEGVAAVVLDPAAKTRRELEHGFAVVIVLELADAKPASAVLKMARDKLKTAKKKIKLRPEGTGFSADLPAAEVPFVRARVAGGRLFVGVGQKKLVERAALAIDKGKGTLGDDPAHARALTALPATSQLRLWIDLGRAATLAAANAPPEGRAALDAWSNVSQGPKRLTSGLSFTAALEDDRVRLELDEINGIGVFAAFGIYGVRRYLVRAKGAEARNTINAMSRAAAAAYEREVLGPNNTVLHHLCKSARPVPSAVPRGKKYMPDPSRDWNTGDADHGWRCLKFEVSEPQYYQYTYTVGGPYKGPKRGGPDPGPNGFEIAAEGDLDGDGVTSLFTRTGVVDPQAGVVRISPELWVDKEDE